MAGMIYNVYKSKYYMQVYTIYIIYPPVLLSVYEVQCTMYIDTCKVKIYIIDNRAVTGYSSSLFKGVIIVKT